MLNNRIWTDTTRLYREEEANIRSKGEAEASWGGSLQEWSAGAELQKQYGLHLQSSASSLQDGPFPDALPNAPSASTNSGL